jgi:hypothetical protein
MSPSGVIEDRLILKRYREHTGVFSYLCFPSLAVFHGDAGLLTAWGNLALEGL